MQHLTTSPFCSILCSASTLPAHKTPRFYQHKFICQFQQNLAIFAKRPNFQLASMSMNVLAFSQITPPLRQMMEMTDILPF
jgi:hypothetical protein